MKENVHGVTKTNARFDETKFENIRKKYTNLKRLIFHKYSIKCVRTKDEFILYQSNSKSVISELKSAAFE
jgi:hypothetical protein